MILSKGHQSKRHMTGIMAGIRGNRPRAGSPSWISQERSCALQIVQSETEEFTYSVRNEVDWLNEHMAEIFNANHVSVAEMFKTPGKLRGKTPRTLRKNNHFLERPPLSSIFSTIPIELASNAKKISSGNPQPTFEVAEDQHVQVDSQSSKTSYQISTSQSEENNLPQQGNDDRPTSEYSSHRSLSTQLTEPDKLIQISNVDSNKLVDSSGNFFQEGSQINFSRSSEALNLQASPNSGKPNDENRVNKLGVIDEKLIPNSGIPKILELNRTSSPQKSSPRCLSEKKSLIHQKILQQQDLSSSPVIEPIENELNDVNSQSDGSSPIRLIVRKSSLNFASLPAREPLTTKKSIGNSVSRLSQLDLPRVSHFGRKATTKSTEINVNEEDVDSEDLESKEIGNEDSDSSMVRLQKKISTQRLQEKVTRLNGSSKNSRKSNSSDSTVQLHFAEIDQELNSTNPSNCERMSLGCENELVPNDYNRNCAGNSVDTLKHTSVSPRQELRALKNNNFVSKNNYEKSIDESSLHTLTPKPINTDVVENNIENHVNFVSPLTRTSGQSFEERRLQDNKISITKGSSKDSPQPIEISLKPTHVQKFAPSEQYETIMEAKKLGSSKEIKESNQMNLLLEKARLKVREEAHFYHLEQERVTFMQVEKTSKRSHEKELDGCKSDVTRVTRNSPRKVKLPTEAEKADTTPSVMEPPKKENGKIDVFNEIPPSAVCPKSQVGRQDKKRPLKPTRDISKTKPPTVIKVDIGSQRGQQHHLSNATLSATLQDSLSCQTNVAPQSLKHKASISSIHSKSSSSSFKSAATKALEAAARKKEKDQLVAARKREIKLENERQRILAKEEEQRRQQEAEYQAELQREKEKSVKLSETKKAASRQAIEKRRLEIEKTKESRRAQTGIRNKVATDSEKVLSTSSKLDTGQLRVQKIQQDTSRIVCSNLSSTTKLPPKRLFQHESEDQHLRPSIQRNGTSIFQNEQYSKRRKTTESDGDGDSENDRPKMTAPPVRQSSIRYKDMPPKSIFSHSHANNVASNNLQRSTLISQHNLIQSKPTHPLDMVQLAKGPIPFASIPSQGNQQPQKAPTNAAATKINGKPNTRTITKTITKSSPRYQNGENIDLPEIHTDSDDDSEDQPIGVRPGWTDTPEIQKQLEYQEIIDPAEVFGQPGPLNMEEVFSKSKDRFHKFRARTSSANWSGTDRLTEDEIQKDLEGRDRVRRQGGWTYDAMV
ncbi:putative inner centromere protein [Erysiphe necator]|uniref:Putative inner centromere protein n=1 Tax=Uncinula necator TaxID=52586 RepID=A0A0B1NZ98_UNCNE|nr:putative inner centromere protein [Erysiphe necator]